MRVPFVPSVVPLRPEGLNLLLGPLALESLELAEAPRHVVLLARVSARTNNPYGKAA